MIVCPNAKINLGLEVVRRRSDGYHDIETLFVPVPSLRDVLEVVKADKADMVQYGIPCDVPVEKNLCFKAFRLMQEQFGIGNVNIFLYKNIPMGAGLGGGSSDAAFTLMAINEVFQLGLDKGRLASLAAKLGSDCPFFIYNTPMFASGRGEILEPYPIDLTRYRIEVIAPGIHISTAEAYAAIDAYKSESCSYNESLPDISDGQIIAGCMKERATGVRERGDRPTVREPGLHAGPLPGKDESLKERLAMPVESWRENVVNDFEAYAFAKYPTLAKLKSELYDRGAIYASMTGSGSAMYALFEK